MRPCCVWSPTRRASLSKLDTLLGTMAKMLGLDVESLVATLGRIFAAVVCWEVSCPERVGLIHTRDHAALTLGRDARVLAYVSALRVDIRRSSTVDIERCGRTVR
jgi:hypothetical protein